MEKDHGGKVISDYFERIFIMKSVGVIGGLGPETTAEFYLKVVFSCQKLNAKQRPLIVISSVPLPFEIERDLIETNTGKERYIPYLTVEAERLERTGVDFLVMPCNSLHVFINEIRSAVKIPVLSIVEETTRYIKSRRLKKVGLISTSATVENKVYENHFIREKVDFIVPDDFQRAEMDKIITNLIAGVHLNNDRVKIMNVIDGLKTRGATAVCLACTDLQLLLPGDDNVTVFDTMEVLAEAVVRDILK
jgi:aspartate racemase